MATYPKIGDNEMNYFQFKARQMLLKKKEDREWQDFCKQIAPECTACLAEQTDTKHVGIQTGSKKPINKIERTTFESKYKNEQIPEALNNIKSQLEKIDFALSKIYDVPNEKEKEKKPKAAPMLHSEKTFKSFEEQRKLFIQNSLKASLKKLHDSSFEISKKSSPTIKLKNSSFFIPHDLQVKRAASRRAYLVSLQTKPKISFQNVSRNNKKNIPTSQNKKGLPSQTPKKKVITKKENKESNIDEEETQIAANEDDDDAKDENIEHVVDGILEDLLGDAALDLNKVKQGKSKRNSNTSNQKADADKETETDIPSISAVSSSRKNTFSKALASNDNISLANLKSFYISSKEVEPKRGNLKKVLIDRSTSTFSEEAQNAAKRSNSNPIQHQKPSVNKTCPKFMCEVSHIITVNPEMAKDISENKERFSRYLKKISRTIKGNFNPWVLNEMLAESILDECVNDIAEELSEVPSGFVKDLYNEEFIQQVVD